MPLRNYSSQLFFNCDINIVLKPNLSLHSVGDPSESKSNKTVLLRERKRHTARRVPSTPSTFLSGGRRYPSPGRGGGTSSVAGGVPHFGLTPPSPQEGTWDQWKYYEMMLPINAHR